MLGCDTSVAFVSAPQDQTSVDALELTPPTRCMVQMEVNSRSPTNLLAAAHLLTLLLTEHNEVKKTTVAPGEAHCLVAAAAAHTVRQYWIECSIGCCRPEHHQKLAP